MTIRSLSPILAALTALTAVACGRPSPDQMVDDTIAVNSTALTHTEWEMSDKHPSRLFARWRSEKRMDSDVCPALKSRKADELTLFEEEIRKKANAELVAGCKEQLLHDIGAYWALQIDRSKHVRLDFKFPQVKQTMDFSHGQYIVNADLKPKQVLLTFDDGPHAKNTDVILRNLRKVGAKAIFFHMGRNVRVNAAVAKRVAADGHGIGSHSMTHQCLAPTSACARNNGKMLTFAQATAEIMGGHTAVQEVLGFVDPFFRFPYGANSPELKKFVADRGVGEFFWSIDSNDWRNQSPAMLVDSVMSQLKRAGDHGVILMHDIQKRTTVALPSLLQRLHDGGYQVVTLRPARERDRFESRLAQRRAK